MKPKEFLKLKAKTEIQIENLSLALDKARDRVRLPAKSKLRQATIDDIREGAIIFYVHPDGDIWWDIVSEITGSSDTDFKAYVSDNGCRHGLWNAFVEK